MLVEGALGSRLEADTILAHSFEWIEFNTFLSIDMTIILINKMQCFCLPSSLFNSVNF